MKHEQHLSQKWAVIPSVSKMSLEERYPAGSTQCVSFPFAGTAPCQSQRGLLGGYVLLSIWHANNWNVSRRLLGMIISVAIAVIVEALT